MVLGVAVFAFHGIFHPLFHSPHTASCADLTPHFACAELALPLPSVPVAWRHDALCPICHADFSAELPDHGAEVEIAWYELGSLSMPEAPAFCPEYFVSPKLRGPPAA